MSGRQIAPSTPQGLGFHSGFICYMQERFKGLGFRVEGLKRLGFGVLGFEI